jgi:hypothetical protein
VKHRLIIALSATQALAGDPCGTAGSALVDRSLIDSSSGLVLIYRGTGEVTEGPATADAWSFFSDSGNTGWITPLLFRVEGNSFVLVGVGASRQNTATGVQSHPFGETAGSTELDPGQSYTFGFTTRLLAAAGTPGGLSTVQYSGAVVHFDGYSIQTDPWDYSIVSELSLGQEFGPGPGQSALNSLGFEGRIYSAQFEVSCNCPADLAPPTGTLNFFDVSAFLGAYNTQAPQADFAAPFGTFNFFDVSAFLAAYNAGC